MKSWLIAVGLLLAATVAPAGPEKQQVKFIISSQSQTDKRGSTEAASAATALEQFVAEALMNKYPCAATLRQSELGDLLDLERRRQLLGGEGGDEQLAAIASAAGADYYVHVRVIEMGGRLSVNGMMLDSKTAKVAARQGRDIPLNEETVEELEAFARQIAQGLNGPVCPGAWVGTVTASYENSWTGEHGDGGSDRWEASFNVRGEGGQLTTVRYAAHEKISMVTGLKGHEKVEQASEADAAGSMEGFISVRVHKETIQISFNSIKMVGKYTYSAAPGGAGKPWQREVNLGSVTARAVPDSDKQSGSYRDSLGREIKWTLSRAKEASAR